MSYTDTTYAPLANYTYVHNKQIYDGLASQLAAHSAWQFVESVDYVSGTTTVTTYVWKNKATVSGLIADFYVGFSVPYANNVGAGLGYSTTLGMRTFLFEQYNSTTHVASKIAMVSTSASQTLASDGSNPTTWTLTAAYPQAGNPNNVAFGSIGPGPTSTSWRLLVTVSNYAVLGRQPGGREFYIGAIDPFLDTAIDPLPIIIYNRDTQNQGNQYTLGVGTFAQTAAFTRHPGKGGQTGTWFLGGTTYPCNDVGINSSSGWLDGNYLAQNVVNNTQGGTIGLPADPNAPAWNGIQVSRSIVSTRGGTAAALGGARGLFKHIYIGYLAAHNYGDTFVVNGAACVGPGNASAGWNAVFDTTA